ncbi:MAG TPA: glycoside hydrolase family 172 protein [Pyrinomonadaceae bacterium]|nr:glycoside hydrolase family 172 protein [Pyrinomonadaceae bacterium]
MKRILLTFVAPAALSFACAATALAQAVIIPPPPRPGVEELYRLDALPAFKRSIAVGSVSSYDRTGGNDDGFRGTYSFVRKEPGGLVIADLKGPGVIYRIWTPTPTDDTVEFYFDGETTPRISLPFRDLFSGRRFPFLPPVAAFGAGGFYSYVPLPYKESCKVVVKAEGIQFYQINYATYAADAGVESYKAEAPEEFRQSLEKARKFFASAGADLSAYGAADSFSSSKVQTRRFSGPLAPGKTVTLFESNRPGRVVGLRLGPAQAFAGKGRDVLLRILWDGESAPAVECPVGDFFGYSFGQPAVKSLLVGTSEDKNYVYVPMPFDKSARIELVSQKAEGAPVGVEAEVMYTEVGRSKDEGKFYALWHRENPTTAGRPFTFLDVKGRGHVVGFVLQAQGAEPGAIPEFFEGDDRTDIDGALAVHGTGSEDFFNGGWYDAPGRWEDRLSLPLSGCLEFKRYVGRTGGYRFLLADAYAYRRGIVSTIEHGPHDNNVAADYTAVTYFYSEHNPTLPSTPAPAERKVNDPERIVFTPGWTTPVQAFSWSNAVLAKRDDLVGGEQLRHLSMKAEGREVFGDHYITFLCELPAAGKYRVSIQAIEGPAQAVVQIFRNEVAIGDAADLYAPERRKGAVRPLGELDMKEGDNKLMFKLTGKNPQSTSLGFDLYKIIFERVD